MFTLSKGLITWSDSSPVNLKVKRVELKLIKKIEQDSRDFLNSSNTFPQTSLREVAGYLAYEDKAKTIDELNDAIEEGILEKYGDRSTYSPLKNTES